MTPQEVIFKHKDLIELVIKHQYIPHQSQANFGEVKKALQDIDGIVRDGTCQGCIGEVIRMADVHLRAYEATLVKVEEPVFHTFPSDKPEIKRRKRGPNKKK